MKKNQVRRDLRNYIRERLIRQYTNPQIIKGKTPTFDHIKTKTFPPRKALQKLKSSQQSRRP